jgi:transposase InsO family protein
LDIKSKNPTFGSPKIADMLVNIFGENVNKDVVRRVIDKYYKPHTPLSPGDGPSWLAFLGHTKDSLWSVDMFRCESILLQTYWVMVVMDQFTRRIVGFSVCKGAMKAEDLCDMFYRIIPYNVFPKRLSSDNDPLFESLLWKINLIEWGIDEVKSVPSIPWSHPFVERLIKSVRYEYLDSVLFWNGVDFEQKLSSYKEYFNSGRVHRSLGGEFPLQVANEMRVKHADIADYKMKSFCNGMFRIPIAA